MKNADLFKDTFGMYATEIWSMQEKDFLKWLNEDAKLKTYKWIPITKRPMTEDEKPWDESYYDEAEILNCQLPEDGETVLITDRLGNVEVDTFIYDSDGCYFECNCNMDDVKAWMPLPEPYKEVSE